MAMTTAQELLAKYQAGERNFAKAYLRFADLRDAILQDANLQGANLEGADLRFADLRNVNLMNADLRSTDLLHADLREANLRGADLDFSCLPFWCGSLHMKLDRRQLAQIAYHFCNQECDNLDYMRVRNALLAFANTFHRVGENGFLEGYDL
jgi:uncharacterized protein YjbI with pentapeptide repeats